MTASAHQPETARLLELCAGRGEVVLISPADPDRADHFYAGITRPPTLSMLDAILLILGGRLSDGSRRYNEVVVVSSGLKYNEKGKDCPSDELLLLDDDRGGSVVRGDEWRTWWYRRPSDAVSAPAAPRPITVRPSPLPSTHGEGPYPTFEIEIQGDRGAAFPNRHQALRRMIGRLQSRTHPTLLVVNLAVLDYPSPEAIEPDTADSHSQIHEVGIRDLHWLTQFINDVGARGTSRLDVVLYTRNDERVNAFLVGGLPRAPKQWSGPWPHVAYEGSRLPHVFFPCGRYPWGNRFSGDEGFGTSDGTPRSTVAAQNQYHRRTLRQLLRGRTLDGEVTRLRAGNVAPMPPVVTGDTDGLDPVYWARLDVPAVEAAFRRRYFVSAAIDCRATKEPRPELTLIDHLFKTMRRLSDLARADPRELRAEHVAKAWKTASTFLLFGAAGTGKTALGQMLCPLMFGHEAHVIRGGQIGGGGDIDPAAHLKFTIFGASHPYAGAGNLTATGSHLVQHHGFTVLIFDELEKANPGDLQSVFSPLYELLERRVYTPTNGRRPIQLLNGLVIVTSNLSAWPPPEITPENRGAIERRMLPWHYGDLSPEEMRRCAEWFMVNHIQERLDQTAVCYCSRSIPQMAGLPLSASMPSSVRSDLEQKGYLARLDQLLVESRQTAENAPPFLDVAPMLEAALG